ncbi:cytochrome P450 [Roseomonas elaeocarpi]|uniref:Cytochrome P450 n=1 Tax=Roseomonas elaeocarpi TaxID=907779 RepID=A0ABV6JME4_9PROT
MPITETVPATTATHGTAGPLLAAFDAIADKGGDPKEIAGRQFRYILDQIRGNALPFFGELREDRPILVSPAATLVSRFRDVEEILHRETIFSVSPYLPRMMGVIGPFVLSQDVTPRYDHDISIMRLVVQREDLSRVKQLVSHRAARIVETLARGHGPFEIVQTLTRKVPVRLAAEYFGFAASDDAQMMEWARAGFREFFINLRDAPEMRAPAVAAGTEMRARLDALLAERIAGRGEHKDDVMDRLLRLRAAGVVDDELIRRTLAGLVIGMIETTSQAAVQALLVLFSMPDALARAAAAARADDDAALSDLVFEALRFRPINPMVVRVAREDYLLAAGEPHATLISKGSTVFALTWSAMFDPRVLEQPEEFRPGRPGHHVLHFATGLHSCYGRYISQIQIPQILKPLLRLPGLHPAGAPEYDGTFPQKLLVSTS